MPTGVVKRSRVKRMRSALVNTLRRIKNIFWKDVSPVADVEAEDDLEVADVEAEDDLEDADVETELQDSNEGETDSNTSRDASTSAQGDADSKFSFEGNGNLGNIPPIPLAGLRPIYIDGVDVGTLSGRFHPEIIQQSKDYFTQRGHKVTVLLPKTYYKGKQLAKMEIEGFMCITPCPENSDGIIVECDHLRILAQVAMVTGGIVVTNQTLEKVTVGNAHCREAMRKRLLRFQTLKSRKTGFYYFKPTFGNNGVQEARELSF